MTSPRHLSPRPGLTGPVNRCLLAAAALSLCGAVQAQTQSQAPTDAECADATITTPECVAKRKRKQDEERASRSAEFGSPQAVGDAPLPPQGAPVTKPPTITRGPLRVRRAELSLGVDHALSPQWVVGGLVGVSRTRLHRAQSELAADADPGSPPDPVSDTTVHARGTTLAATLTNYPRDDVFIDATLAVQRTSLTDDRLVNDIALFSGSTHARAVSLSLTAGGTWRYAKGMAVIPQAGLEYVDSRVDPLQTNYTFVDTGEGPFPGFEVSGQHQKALLALGGAQVQWRGRGPDAVPRRREPVCRSGRDTRPGSAARDATGARDQVRALNRGATRHATAGCGPSAGPLPSRPASPRGTGERTRSPRGSTTATRCGRRRLGTRRQ